MPSKQSLEAGNAPFVEMQNMTRDAIEQHIETRYGKQVSQGWI
jgi:hypothetical protein